MTIKDYINKLDRAYQELNQESKARFGTEVWAAIKEHMRAIVKEALAYYPFEFTKAGVPKSFLYDGPDSYVKDLQSFRDRLV